MSGGVLAWAKRVEAHMAQAAVLNALMESRQFDKIILSKKVKENRVRTPVHQSTPQQSCRYCRGDPPATAMPSIWQGVHGVK